MATAEIVRVDTPTFAVQRAGRQNVGEYTMIASDTDDRRVVEMWINRKNRSENTKEQYRLTWRQFHEAVPVPLQTVTYEHLHDWSESLASAGLSANTQKVKISSVRSLFSFAHRIGYLRVNPAIMLEPPKAKAAKHARMLTEEQVLTMIAVTKNPRNKALLRVLYSSGARISELLALTWQDVVPLTNGKAVLMLFGKGAKEREADISAATYAELLKLRNGAGDNEPVFKSNRGTALDRSMALRIVKQAAEAAGIDKPVSPHWLRHSTASHALDRGANIKAVQKKLGHSSLTITSEYLHTDEGTADFLAV